jgi:general secretion pathway protein G
MKRSLSSLSGFTLLEIMLVVMIIGLLVGGAIKFLLPNLDIGKEARVRGDLQAIGTSLMVYESTTGSPPTTDQGLKALVTRPETEPRPRQWRSIMTDVPRDPYHPQQDYYRYEYPGKRNPNGYDLYSVGKDKTPGTADDIGNWES